MPMHKVASEAVLAALKTAGPTLRKLASERDVLERENAELRDRVNQLEQTDKVQKLAHEVHEKHLEEGRTVEETEQFLLEKAANGELGVYEEAIKLASGHQLIGTPGEHRSTAGSNALEQVIFGD